MKDGKSGSIIIERILFLYNKTLKEVLNMAVSINGDIISIQECIKYLGVTLDKKLENKLLLYEPPIMTYGFQV